MKMHLEAIHCFAKCIKQSYQWIGLFEKRFINDLFFQLKENRDSLLEISFEWKKILAESSSFSCITDALIQYYPYNSNYNVIYIDIKGSI